LGDSLAGAQKGVLHDVLGYSRVTDDQSSRSQRR